MMESGVPKPLFEAECPGLVCRKICDKYQLIPFLIAVDIVKLGGGAGCRFSSESGYPAQS